MHRRAQSNGIITRRTALACYCLNYRDRNNKKQVTDHQTIIHNRGWVMLWWCDNCSTRRKRKRVEGKNNVFGI